MDHYSKRGSRSKALRRAHGFTLGALLASTCLCALLALGGGATASEAGLPVIEALSAHRGAVSGGERIKIRGRNLAQASAVYFGHFEDGTPIEAARLADLENGEVEVEAPAHNAGAVQVRVRTPAGVSEEKGLSEAQILEEEEKATPATPALFTYGPTVVAVKGPGGSDEIAGTQAGEKITVEGIGLEASDEVVLLEGCVQGSEFGFNFERTLSNVTYTPHAGSALGTLEGTLPNAVLGAGGFEVVSHAEKRCHPNQPEVDTVVVRGAGGTSPPSAAGRLFAGPSIEAIEGAELPSSGGQQITIRGHGFESGAGKVVTAVSIGGERLTPSSQSRSEIKVTAPAHAPGAVPVQLYYYISGSHEAQTAAVPGPSDTLYYGPVITALSRHGAPLGQSTTITVEGHGFERGGSAEVTGASFGGAAGEALKVLSAQRLEVRAPALSGALEAHLTLAGPEGSSAEEEASLFVFGLPIIEALSPREGSYLGGELLTISGQNLAGVRRVTFFGKQASLQPREAEEGAHGHLRVALPFAGGSQNDALPLIAESALGISPAWLQSDFTPRSQPEVQAIAPAEGPDGGGTQVKIFATAFSPIKEVYFGSRRAPFANVVALHRGNVASEGNGEEGNQSGTIIATAPPDPEGGSVDIRLVGPEGESLPTPSDRFTYPRFGLPQSGPGSFEALTCSLEDPFCGYLSPPEALFMEASGYAPYFDSGFEMAAGELQTKGGQHGRREPAGVLKSVREDLPAGLIFNPQAVPQCAVEKIEEATAHCPQSLIGFAYVAVQGPLGEARRSGLSAGEQLNDDVAGIYNLKPRPPAAGEEAAPAEFGFVALEVHGAPEEVFIRGHLSWHREAAAEAGWGAAQALSGGDYHAYATVSEAPDLPTPVFLQRLVFFGNAGEDGLITEPSQCASALTYHLRLESYGYNEANYTANHTLTGQESVPPGTLPQVYRAASESADAAGAAPLSGCSSAGAAPFSPAVALQSSSASAGAPNGATIEVSVPQGLKGRASADAKVVSVTMPEGMSVNPSEANGLEACSDEEEGIEESGARAVVLGSSKMIESHGEEVESPPPPPRCKPSSKIGSFAIETPDLPAPRCTEKAKTSLAQCPSPAERTYPLEGSIYVAAPTSDEPQSGNEYRIFLDAEAPQYGVSVRQIGHIAANPQTGRLTTTVESPQVPFADAIVRLQAGAKAALANPLRCEAQSALQSLITPYGSSEGPPAASPSAPFALAGCPFAVPFAPTQQSALSDPQAGAQSAFTLTFGRPAEDQYLQAIKTTLPPGLVGAIAAVPVLCSEAQARALACPPESQVGSVRAASGAGALLGAESPFGSKSLLTLGGSVYLTGPIHEGAQSSPFGLAIVVDAEHVGPYDFGKILTIAQISINPETAQVTTTSSVPTIVSGAPVRLRALEVSLNRPSFMRNATSCAAAQIQSLLTGTETLPAGEGAKASLATPYTPANCAALAFDPSFSATTQAKTSRLEGAALTVKVAQRPGEADLRRVDVQLPVALPSRLSTLQHACTEAQFAADPAACPPQSFVGTATAITPLLKSPLSGPAILVSHGGAQFPDLEFLLEGEGVKVTLDGKTQIKDGITYSKFESIPDTPISSFETVLPEGPHSILAANGSLCTTTKSVRRIVYRRRHGRIVRRRLRVTLHVPRTLQMPTTLESQSGVLINRTTKIEVQGCTAAKAKPKAKRKAKKARAGRRRGARRRHARGARRRK